MDLNLNRFEGTIPYRNIEYLGRCYDFIKLNPLDLGERLRDGGGCMPTFAIDIPPEVCDVKSSDQNVLIPRGSRYLSESRAEKSSRTQVWYSAHDFCDSFKNTVSGGLSISGMFSFSASASFEELHKATASSEEVMTFVQSFFEDCAVQLQDDFNEHLSLGSKFVQAVKELTSEDLCVGFIQKFGTHYAREVIFGGRMYQRIRMSREAHSSYVQKGVDVSASAEFTYKKASASVGAGASNSSVREITSEKGVTVDDIKWVGGTPDTDFNTWVRSIREDPKPMQLDLVPLHSLFTKEHFPTVSDIQARKEWMEKAVEKHILDNAKFATPLTKLANKEFYIRHQGYDQGKGSQVGKLLGVDKDYTEGFKMAALGDDKQGVVWMLEPAGRADEFYLKTLRSPGAGQANSNKLGFHPSPHVPHLVYGIAQRTPVRLIPVPDKENEYYLRYPASGDVPQPRAGLGLGYFLNNSPVPTHAVALYPKDHKEFLTAWKLEPVPEK